MAKRWGQEHDVEPREAATGAGVCAPLSRFAPDRQNGRRSNGGTIHMRAGELQQRHWVPGGDSEDMVERRGHRRGGVT